MYHSAAKLAILAESGQSYKSALYSSKNKKRIKSVHFLVSNAVKKKDIIDELLSKVGLLKEVKSSLWLSRILVTELIWGHGQLPTLSPLFKRVAECKDKFLEVLSKDENFYPEDDPGIPRYIRINSEVFTRESALSFLKENGFEEVTYPNSYEGFISSVKSLKKREFMFDFHVPYLIVFEKKAKIDVLPYVSFIRQDKSSCLVSLLLAPVPGASILDMCAAPGYKTQHASSLIHKMGKIYSVDINKERYKTLQKTCKDFALQGCVEPLNMDALKTSADICPDVEYLIVDPPCSGTGIANILVKHTADSSRLKKLSNLQAMILKHALKTFPRARRLVYSTCSVEVEENEGVVEECLEVSEEEGWSLVPLQEAFRSSFAHGSRSLGPSVLRLSPKRDLTNGFFIALFERSVPPAYSQQSPSQENGSQAEVLPKPNDYKSHYVVHEDIINKRSSLKVKKKKLSSSKISEDHSSLQDIKDTPLNNFKDLKNKKL